MKKLNITLGRATINEAEIITKLVNSVYRGENAKKGWTTEADLLDGIRITSGKIKEIIKSKKEIIVTAKINNKICGCVHLEQHNSYSVLGMLSVDVKSQNYGIGKLLISKCEEITKNEWKFDEIRMIVISVRTELIEYYKRRGYIITDKILPFKDIADAFGNPKFELYFIELKKLL